MQPRDMIKQNEDIIKLMIARFPDQFSKAKYNERSIIISINNPDELIQKELFDMLTNLIVFNLSTVTSLMMNISRGLRTWNPTSDTKISIFYSADDTQGRTVISDLKKYFDYWLAHHSAFTAGAAAGLFKHRLPKDIGKQIGLFLNRQDAVSIVKTRKDANITANEEAAKYKLSF